MSDPLAGIPIPASRIDDDVAEVMASQTVHWASLESKLDTATWAQLKLLASGVGEPSE